MIGRPRKQSQFVLRFFLSAAALFGLAGLAGHSLVHWVGCPAGRSRLFPPAFWVSTLMLLTGSVTVQRAIAQVRRERQRPFRRSLLLGLAAGTAFVAFQGAGLYCLTQTARASDPATGAAGFVLGLTVLHALHLTVALLFLVWITLRALDGRYDHEYYWGVTLCAAFWHFLGVVWLGILCVFFIVATFPAHR